MTIATTASFAKLFIGFTSWERGVEICRDKWSRPESWSLSVLYAVEIKKKIAILSGNKIGIVLPAAANAMEYYRRRNIAYRVEDKWGSNICNCHTGLKDEKIQSLHRA